MSYAAVVEVNMVGDNEFEVEIAETDCGASDIATVVGLPIVGTVVRQTCVLVSGTGTTVDPLLGENTPPTTGDPIVENATPAATVDTGGAAAYNVEPAASATLYHMSRPNAGTNNVIRTNYKIKAGW